MKAKWKEVLCFFIVKLMLIKCDYFSIVGSAVLRIDEPYRVNVISHDESGRELNVKIGIQGVTNQGENIQVSQDLVLNPGSAKMLKFRFANLTLGTYKLSAQARNFSKSADLFINTQKVTVMIQFDKPIYKTTDVVNFRIFAIDSRTKPYKNAVNSRICILDLKNNRLREWKNVNFTMGVFRDNFEFTKLHPGEFEMIAEVDGTITSRKFEIFKEPELIYDLKLLVPEKVLFRDGDMRIKISINFASKYALENMHSISGNLILKCDDYKVVKYQKIINATQFEIYETIDFINDLGLEYLDDRKTFVLKVIFTDDITTKNFTSTSKFTIELSDYQIQIVHSPKYFKIGLPYSFTLLVTRTIDEYPVLDSIDPIHVVVKDDKNKTLIDDDFQLDLTFGSVEIYTPEISKDTLFLNIFAKYDKIQYFQQVNLSSTQRSDSIAIDVLTARPRMYEQVDFELMTTSKSTPFAVFQIFSKGLLKMSKIIPFENGYANFTIIPKFSYTPKAHCMAYLITDYGDLISDSITLYFESQFPNYVHLEVNSSDLANPGSEFSLNVTSTLHSSVNLMAIDLRGISQRFRHDISKDYIFDNELFKYDRALIENFYDFEIPFWFYPFSYQKPFFEIGAVIISNAVQDIPCKPEISNSSIFTRLEIDDDQIIKSKEYMTKVGTDDIKQYIDGFLFETIEIDAPIDDTEISGEKFLVDKLPDSSNSWAFTAITLNDEYGLGMTVDPFVLESFKRFYIDCSVPVFSKIGEIFLLEILVGNLFDAEISATVQVFNYEHQGFKIFRPLTYGWIDSVDGVLQNIDIPAFSVHRLVIEISAEAYGTNQIDIKASCSRGIETKTSTINIIPEGFSTQITPTDFIAADSCYSKNIIKSLKCDINEQDVIEDTFRAHATVYSDIMGLTLSNLDSLYKEPIGNIEEILFVFALNVLTLDYLVLTDQISASINIKAIAYLKQSYQKLIRYRNVDGSFSSFDVTNMDGSVWLTANALRYLQKAQRYIDVNENFISEGLVFIASKQQPCGKFLSDAGNILENTTDRNSIDLAFTAFIGILFDQNVKTYPQYISLVQKAVEYVELNYDKSNLYSFTLVTYFMYEVDSPLKYELLQSMLNYIQRFSSRDVFLDQEEFSVKNVTSLDVEINAYCLMLLDHIPEFYSEAFNIVQWLLIQQKPDGKFISTQDTIIALEAISRFAARLSSTEENLEINLSPNSDEDYTISAKLINLATQAFKLPPTTRHMDVSAHGNGFAVVQLSCNYYAFTTQTHDAIKLNVEFKDGSCSEYLVVRMSLELSVMELSDILIISVESPSGFVYDSGDLKFPEYIMNIEELHKRTLIHVYLKNFGSTAVFDIPFLRKFIVLNNAFSNIEIYDFYNQNIKTSLFYKTPENVPPCSNQTITTSPPIYQFTTLEPLSTKYQRDLERSTKTKAVDISTTEGSDYEDERLSTTYDDEITGETTELMDNEEEDYGLIAPRDEETEKISNLDYNGNEAVFNEGSTSSEKELETDEITEEEPNSKAEQNEEYLDYETTESVSSTSEDILDESPKFINDEGEISEADEFTSQKYKNFDEISDYEFTTEYAGSNEPFPNEEEVDDNALDDSEGFLNTNDEETLLNEEYTTTTEYETTTPEEAEETTTTISKEKFKKKIKPNAIPRSFKNKPRPSMNKIPKFPSKMKKSSWNKN